MDISVGLGGYRRNRNESRILWMSGPEQLSDNLAE